MSALKFHPSPFFPWVWASGDWPKIFKEFVAEQKIKPRHPELLAGVLTMGPSFLLLAAISPSSVSLVAATAGVQWVTGRREVIFCGQGSIISVRAPASYIHPVLQHSIRLRTPGYSPDYQTVPAVVLGVHMQLLSCLTPTCAYFMGLLKNIFKMLWEPSASLTRQGESAADPCCNPTVRGKRGDGSVFLAPCLCPQPPQPNISEFVPIP